MRYLIRNGMIVDGTGRAPFAGSVLTQDSKIEAIFPGWDNEQAGQAASQDVVVLDAGGGYITPGFVDIHPAACRQPRREEATSWKPNIFFTVS